MLREVGIEFNSEMTMEDKKVKIGRVLMQHLPCLFIGAQLQSEEGEWEKLDPSDPLVLLFARRAIFTYLKIMRP